MKREGPSIGMKMFRLSWRSEVRFLDDDGVAASYAGTNFTLKLIGTLEQG